mmetsp:Transcript_109989/g.354733  ORF Transcript_109989/g.354733 Transcript_109989/m.354733 type:complete len:524 (-) Transcript_109989:26-1597(-)
MPAPPKRSTVCRQGDQQPLPLPVVTEQQKGRVCGCRSGRERTRERAPHLPSRTHERWCQGELGLLRDAAHHRDRLNGELAHGRLRAEHHGIGAVQHGVRHIAGLRACGEGLVFHGGHHLRGRDRVLARGPGLLDHHLLCHPDLLHGDLHAQVAARHHDAVGLRQDGIEVLQALHVLDLGDDLDGLAAAVLTAILDVLGALHEAQGDVVRVVGHCPLHDVLDLALVDDRQVDLDARHIDVLLLTQLAVVHDLGDHVVLPSAHDLQHYGAVLHQDALARLHVLGQLLVGDSDLVLVSLDAVVRHQLQLLASLQLLLRVVDLEGAGADLWATGVHQHPDLAPEIRPHHIDLLQVRELHALLLVIAVRHVAADDVHTRINHLHQHLRIPRLRPDGADDVRHLLHGIHGGDLLQLAGVPHGELLEGLARSARDALTPPAAGRQGSHTKDTGAGSERGRRRGRRGGCCHQRSLRGSGSAQSRRHLGSIQSRRLHKGAARQHQQAPGSGRRGQGDAAAVTDLSHGVKDGM